MHNRDGATPGPPWTEGLILGGLILTLTERSNKGANLGLGHNGLMWIIVFLLGLVCWFFKENEEDGEDAGF